MGPFAPWRHDPRHPVHCERFREEGHGDCAGRRKQRRLCCRVEQQVNLLGMESSDAVMQDMLCRIRLVRRKEHTRRWSYVFGLWSALATLT